MKKHVLILAAFAVVLLACKENQKSKETINENQQNVKSPKDSLPFPFELVQFQTPENNPVFTGGGADNWDQKIRERGYILKEGDTFHMWYTGFRTENESTFPRLCNLTRRNLLDTLSGQPSF